MVSIHLPSTSSQALQTNGTFVGRDRLWPNLPRFSNQMLRYLRKPEGLVHEEGLPAHRAGPDAYVTAYHLRDMLNEASIAQLLALSQ